MKNEAHTVDALVGAALRLLAQSGADDAALGAFAAQYRARVVDVLGQPERAAAQEVDLRELVVSSVHLALAEAGVVKRQKDKRVPVTVRGKRTTLTINPDVLARLQRMAGSRRAAVATLQDLANTAPADQENRSAWVEQRIQAMSEQSAMGRGH